MAGWPSAKLECRGGGEVRCDLVNGSVLNAKKVARMKEQTANGEGRHRAV